MRLKIHSIIMLVLLFATIHPAFSQENTTISESRKANVRKLMDYRFKGGFYTFEKLFSTNVKYPTYSEQVCLVGIVLVEIEISCEGEIVNVLIKNPLRFGVEEDISKFFESTDGKWNKCNDEKYTKVEIPVQFMMDGLETNKDDAMIIIEGRNPGIVCYDDSYYIEKVQKYMEKGNGKKAIENLDVLIQRNPYNTEFYEMKKKAIELKK